MNTLNLFGEPEAPKPQPKTKELRKFRIVSEPITVYSRESQPITSSKEINDLLQKEFKDDMNVREIFAAVYLNRRGVPIRIARISEGGVSATFVDVKTIAKHGIDCLASAVILSHNHPAGTPTPSQPDKTLTKKIKTALECLDIAVLDHVIICDEFKYFSFADEGLL